MRCMSRDRTLRDRHKTPSSSISRLCVATSSTYQFRFPMAVGPDWQTLNCWWLDSDERSWTNISFLIDRRGVTRRAPGRES
jgi:hypothetical protein